MQRTVGVHAFYSFRALLCKAQLDCDLDEELRAYLDLLIEEDAPTLFPATMMMIVMAALAVYLPARKAARVDPIIALRQE